MIPLEFGKINRRAATEIDVTDGTLAPSLATMARIRRHLQHAAEARTAADAPRDEDGLESGAGRDDQSAVEAACVSVAAGLGQNSARSSYPDPLADAVLADERMSFASTPPAAAIRRLPPRARSST